MERPADVRQHLEDARRALAPVAALLQQLDRDVTRAAEDPTPEARAALAADLHQTLAALAEGADALLAIRTRLDRPSPPSRATAGRGHNTEGD